MPKLQPATASAGRGNRGRRVSTSLAEINVVPLVDVMLVLLIIFMITAPMIQRGAEVKLPVATKTNQMAGERVFVTIPVSYRQNHFVYFGNGKSTHDDPVKIDVLQERIRQKMENAAEKKVYLRGDRDVTYQELMEVMDRLKAAGVSDVGMIADLPGAK